MARPCIVCGVRVEAGSRCPRHATSGGRPRPCKVCGRATTGGDWCRAHEPSETDRLAAQPYRANYGSAQYRRNRKARFALARGCCEVCGVPLVPGRWECHHVVELADGGTNALENLRALCLDCHGRITKTRRGRVTRR